MWLLARMVVVLGGVYARWRLRRRVVQPTGRQWGVAYSVFRERRGKNPHITIGVPLESRTLFRVGRPNRWSRWFDKLGLTPEMRTGQLEFDKKYSVIADHRYFGVYLRKEKALREAMLRLENVGADAIYADGRVLWIRFGETVDAESHFPELVALKRILAPMEKTLPHRLADWTLWKAFVVESMLYAAFAYGTISVAFEWVGARSVYLQPKALLLPAAAAGLALCAVLLAVTFVLTLRNARASSMRTEAVAMCFFLLPLGGYGIASQANRWLDSGSVVQASAEVASKEKSPTDGKFFLNLRKTRQPASLETALPPRVEVSPGTYKQAKAGGRVKLLLGRGKLGAEWIRAFRIP